MPKQTKTRLRHRAQPHKQHDGDRFVSFGLNEKEVSQIIDLTDNSENWDSNNWDATVVRQILRDLAEQWCNEWASPSLRGQLVPDGLVPSAKSAVKTPSPK